MRDPGGRTALGDQRADQVIIALAPTFRRERITPRCKCGEGIAGEIAGSLFDPYVTTKTTGSGLGLAIVKKIVDEHGGIVWAENTKQGGARFVVRLPILSPDKDSPRSEKMAQIESESLTQTANMKVMP